MRQGLPTKKNASCFYCRHQISWVWVLQLCGPACVSDGSKTSKVGIVLKRRVWLVPVTIQERELCLLFWQKGWQKMGIEKCHPSKDESGIAHIQCVIIVACTCLFPIWFHFFHVITSSRFHHTEALFKRDLIRVKRTRTTLRVCVCVCVCVWLNERTQTMFLCVCACIVYVMQLTGAVGWFSKNV